MVEPHHGLNSESVKDLNFNTGGAFQFGQKVGLRYLDKVDLAGDQGIGASIGVRDPDKLHAVHMDDLAAGRAAGRFLAGHIIFIFYIHGRNSGLEFLFDELEGA